MSNELQTKTTSVFTSNALVKPMLRTSHEQESPRKEEAKPGLVKTFVARDGRKKKGSKSTVIYAPEGIDISRIQAAIKMAEGAAKSSELVTGSSAPPHAPVATTSIAEKPRYSWHYQPMAVMDWGRGSTVRVSTPVQGLVISRSVRSITAMADYVYQQYEQQAQRSAIVETPSFASFAPLPGMEFAMQIAAPEPAAKGHVLSDYERAKRRNAMLIMQKGRIMAPHPGAVLDASPYAESDAMTLILQSVGTVVPKVIKLKNKGGRAFGGTLLLKKLKGRKR